MSKWAVVESSGRKHRHLGIVVWEKASETNSKLVRLSGCDRVVERSWSWCMKLNQLKSTNELWLRVVESKCIDLTRWWGRYWFGLTDEDAIDLDSLMKAPSIWRTRNTKLADAIRLGELEPIDASEWSTFANLETLTVSDRHRVDFHVLHFTNQRVLPIFISDPLSSEKIRPRILPLYSENQQSITWDKFRE